MNDAAKQTARHASTRIAAIRADIRQVEASPARPARAVQLKALAKDLFEQECKLAEVV